jgi:hypothetical protein
LAAGSAFLGSAFFSGGFGASFLGGSFFFWPSRLEASSGEAETARAERTTRAGRRKFIGFTVTG